jgi:imidazole glycerol-phosphate synthase subunit HisH
VIAIVDYGMGNLRSVERAFAAIREEASSTSDYDRLREADRLVLPGVGAFGAAMHRLRTSGLQALLDTLVLEEGKPLLGICLGMQLICLESDEHGQHRGLGWIDAKVRRFEGRARRLRVPHVGWNEVTGREGSAVCPEDGTFYFVHSYHVDGVDRADVAATCVYGEEFPAALERGNIMAAQFHPEKSQEDGLALLRRFAAWQPTTRVA